MAFPSHFAMPLAKRTDCELVVRMILPRQCRPGLQVQSHVIGHPQAGPASDGKPGAQPPKQAAISSFQAHQRQIPGLSPFLLAMTSQISDQYTSIIGDSEHIKTFPVAPRTVPVRPGTAMAVLPPCNARLPVRFDDREFPARVPCSAPSQPAPRRPGEHQEYQAVTNLNPSNQATWRSARFQIINQVTRTLHSSKLRRSITVKDERENLALIVCV